MSFNDDEINAQEKEEIERAARKKTIFEEHLRREYADYCEESEHGDGYSYWDNFDTPEEFMRDFGTYLVALYGDDEPA